jgi:hypothetical protein
METVVALHLLETNCVYFRLVEHAQIRREISVFHCTLYSAACTMLQCEIRRSACIFVAYGTSLLLYFWSCIMDLKYAQIRSQFQCISHYNLVCYAL